MKKFDLQKLKDLPIEQVATKLGMNIQKHKTLCPFHADKHASLSFYTKRNTFKCFACGEHGGVIDLAMQILGKNFKETCHWLAEEHNIITCHPERSEGSENTNSEKIINQKSDISTKYSKFFERPFLNQPARTFLFQERKLHPAVVRWCRLTSWTDRYGTPWLQIPYYDTDGKLIGIQNRRLSSCHSTPLLRGAGVCHERSEKCTQPRFKFPKGSQCRIYNLPILNLLKEGENLWITEGCSDCWAMLSSGRKAIAIPSATLLNPKDIEVLKNIRNHKSKIINPSLHMSPDNDEPGERLYLQLKTIFPQLVRHPLPDGIKDFAEYYTHCHPDDRRANEAFRGKTKCLSVLSEGSSVP